MHVPGLAHHGDDGRVGVESMPECCVRLRRAIGAPRAAECGQLGVLQLQRLRQVEEFRVLGVGTRPAPLNEIDAQFIQLPSNLEFVLY